MRRSNLYLPDLTWSKASLIVESLAQSTRAPAAKGDHWQQVQQRVAVRELAPAWCAHPAQVTKGAGANFLTTVACAVQVTVGAGTIISTQ